MKLFSNILSAAAMAVALVSSAAAQSPDTFVVPTGTHIALNMINSVSTKHSSPGDRIYLESAFPVVISGHILIPAGSYVEGTVTEVRRPGRVKGKGELYVRFDSLTLPNGVTRDFRSRLGSIDARGKEKLDDKEGQVKSESNVGSDVRTVAEGAATGASVGSIAGAAAGHVGMGAGIGAGAGAIAGIAGVLLTRGPDAILAKGSTVEMVLDRNLVFGADEVNFSSTGGARSGGEGPQAQQSRNDALGGVRRLPH